MMADFLHEIIKKREEHTRISTMINNQDVWANEEVMEPLPAWQRVSERDILASYLPPAGREPF
jgi:hypothetical protein